MSKLNNRYANFSNHRLVVNSLEEDGVIANGSLKEYDEQSTFEGGSGSRLSFKKFNDKIIEYHDILKILSGEQRANIREAIPVIDYLNTENTSLLNTYNMEDGSNTQVDPTSFMTIPNEGDEVPALEYIENEDPYIINRAVMGTNVAEHFWNSTSDNLSDYNLQTAPWNGEYAYIYKGITALPFTNIYGETVNSDRQSEVMVFRSGVVTWLEFSVLNTATGVTGDIDWKATNGNETTDNKGTKIPSINTELNGSTFINQTNEAGTQSSETDPVTKAILKISSGDIIAALPAATYSPDPCRILVYKSAESTGEGTTSYNPYILYVRDFNAGFNFDAMNPSEQLPNYIGSGGVLNHISQYITIDKEFYANASGLLSGYYCEPKEKTDSEIAPKVTKWLFNNDQIEASAKGVSIDVGSKYYKGHLLHRGVIKDQPLAITDFSEGSPEEGYGGKATYIYDLLQNSTPKLLQAVQVPKSRWSNFNLKTVDQVIKKEDYSGSTLSEDQYKDLIGKQSTSDTGQVTLKKTIKYPNKWIGQESGGLTKDELRSYFEACTSRIDGTTLTLDTQNDSACCYSYRIKENSTALNWGWITSTTGEIKGENENNTGNVLDKYSKIYYIYWKHYYKYKRRSTVSSCQDLSVQVASPINYFAKDGTNNTILIYPDYNKYLPTEMYLISRYDLGLEPYKAILPDEDLNTHESTRGMCSFYNRNEGKIISFKVQTVIPFLPSQITRINFFSPLTGGFINVGGRVSGGTNNDCYIYVLQPMEFDLSAIRVRDWDNEEISLGTGEPIQVIPMSYPKGYFEVSEKMRSGERSYEVDQASRGKDVYTLENSYIIPGLPEYSSENELRGLYKSGLDLSIFADLVGDGIGVAAERAIKEGLKYILYNWELSDSTTNPMLLGDIEGILEGAINLKPRLNKLLDAGFEIPSIMNEETDENTMDIITSEDLDGFYKRVTLDESSKERFMYNPFFNTSSKSWDVVVSKPTITWSYERIWGWWGWRVWRPKVTGEVGYDLSNNIKRRLTNCFYNATIEDNNKAVAAGLDKYSIRSNASARVSLTDMLKTFKGTFTSKADLTREMCIKLDSFMGDGTQAFLEFGNPAENTIPGNVISYGNKVNQLIFDLVKNTDRSCKLALREDALKEEYSKYFRWFEYNNGQYSIMDHTDENFKVPMNNKGQIDTSRIIGSFDFASTPEAKTILQKVKDTRGSSNLLTGVKSVLFKSNWLRSYFTGWMRLLNPKSYWSSTNWKWLSLTEWLDYYNICNWNNNTTRTMLNGQSWEIPYEQPALAIKTERDKDKQNILNWYKEEAASVAESYADKQMDDSKIADMLSDDEVNRYLYEPVDGQTNFTLQEVKANTIPAFSNRDDTWYTQKFTFRIPDYDGDTKLKPGVDANGNPDIYEGWCEPYQYDTVDVSTEVLQGINDFVKTSLEGTKTEGNNDTSYYVKYEEGDDSVSGRQNSLYYKRYKMLNNRMNKLEGPLSQAAKYLKAKKAMVASETFQENLAESYRKFIEIVPISQMEELSYFPPQETSTSTISMEGKFYYTRTLEALKAEINSKCVLTCNYCEVKDSCPFYNEDEVLKLYCPEADTLDLWIKDNKPDLIYYGENSPNLKDENGESLDITTLQNMHKPYADVMKKTIGNDEEYIGDYRSLEAVRDELSLSLPSFEEDNRGGLGFLLGGRYGTVQANKMIEAKNDEVDTSQLTKYKYLYDAIFLNDEESYITYMPSTHEYPVSVSMGPAGEKKTYTGTTKIMIPAALTVLATSDSNDDIYLVSDDTSNDLGREIIPVIYLGKVGSLQYTFDLTDNTPDEEIMDSDDTNLYAKDVAQWSINIIKGTCYQDPIGSHDNQSLDRDQYWMETIRKKVVKEGVESYINLEGRKRELSGYQEPVMDPDNFDESLVISGRPVVNSYINFLRRLKIRLNPIKNDDGTILDDSVSIRWIDNNVEAGEPNRIAATANKRGLKVDEETQKDALSYMRTNLRLAIIHQGTK